MSIKRHTVYYEKGGKDHTAETLKISLKAAKERDIGTVVISSTTGYTALEALNIFDGSELEVIIVTHQTGYREPGVQLMPLEARKKLEEAGMKVYTGTDVLTGGVEIGISRPRPPRGDPQPARMPSSLPPVTTVIANILRQFSQGVKVCVEIVMMAADGGLVKPGNKVVCVAGSHAGADTAMVVKASTSNRIKDMRYNEILCKPL